MRMDVSDVRDRDSMSEPEQRWRSRGGPLPRPSPPNAPAPTSASAITTPTEGDDVNLNGDRWRGVERPYSEDDVARLRGRFQVEHTLARLGAERLWQLLAEDDVRRRPRRAHRRPGRPDGAGRPEGDLPLRAGRSRPTRTSPARPTPTRASTRRTAARRSSGASTTRSCAPTRSTTPRARTTPTGSRRSSPTPRPASAAPLNAFELMKAMIEAGRRRRPLRGPARRGEEVRPSRRQGARPDEPVRPHARRGAPRRRRLRRPDGARRPHRRAQRDAAHERRRRARPRVPRPASGRPRASSASSRASRRRSPAALAYAPYADVLWFETVHAGPGRGATVRRGDPRALPGQAPGLQLLADLQLAQAPERRRDRALPATSWPSWATASSSSRWPASTRSTPRCSSSRRATRPRACPPTSRLQEREFALEERGLHGDAPPARGRRRLLRRGDGGGLRRRELDARAEGLDRGGAVRGGRASG